jgi:hypothetical protein
MSVMAKTGTGIFSMFESGIGTVLFTLLPLIAAFGALYAIIKAENGALKELKDSFLETFGNAWLVVSSLFDYFNKGYLPIDKFNQLEQQGLLPIVETILQLIYHFQQFFGAFGEGVVTAINSIADFIDRVINLGDEGEGLGSKFLNFLQTITQPGMIDTWIEMGRKIGEIFTLVAGVIAVVNTLKSIASLVSSPFGIIAGIIAGIFYLFSNNIGGIRDTFKEILNSFDGAGELLNTIFDKVSQKFSEITADPKVSEAFNGLVDSVNIFIGLLTGNATSAVGGLISFAGKLVSVFLDFVTNPAVINFFSLLIDIAVKLFDTLTGFDFSGIFELLINVLSEINDIFSALMPIVEPIFSWLAGTALPAVVGFLLDVANGIIGVVNWFLELKGSETAILIIAGAIGGLIGLFKLLELWQLRNVIAANIFSRSAGSIKFYHVLKSYRYNCHGYRRSCSRVYTAVE